ncbi:MAG: hypothetical protein AAF658_14360 [Myxococcota bacterium]
MNEHEKPLTAADERDDRATETILDDIVDAKPAVVSGTSSVEMRTELRPSLPEKKKKDLLAELDSTEQLTISPDEFDDIWQSGVHARAELLKGLEVRSGDEDARVDTGSFQAVVPNADGETSDWEHREGADEPTELALHPETRESILEEDWQVGSFPPSTADSDPDLAGPTEPARRAPDAVRGPFAGLRRALARFFRAIARWLEPR